MISCDVERSFIIRSKVEDFKCYQDSFVILKLHYLLIDLLMCSWPTMTQSFQHDRLPRPLRKAGRLWRSTFRPHRGLAADSWNMLERRDLVIFGDLRHILIHADQSCWSAWFEIFETPLGPSRQTSYCKYLDVHSMHVLWQQLSCRDLGSLVDHPSNQIWFVWRVRVSLSRLSTQFLEKERVWKRNIHVRLS